MVICGGQRFQIGGHPSPGIVLKLVRHPVIFPQRQCPTEMYTTRATCSVVPTRINNVPLFNFSPDSYAPVASGLKCTPVISKWYEQYVLKLIGCYSTPSFVPRWHWTRNKWYQALGISYMEFRACEKSISRFFPSC